MAMIFYIGEILAFAVCGIVALLTSNDKTMGYCIGGMIGFGIMICIMQAVIAIVYK